MDVTAIGIFIGIAGTIVLAIIQLAKQGICNVLKLSLSFLAMFTIIVGVDLLRAAFLGDQQRLPKSWREYLAVAAVIGI